MTSFLSNPISITSQLNSTLRTVTCNEYGLSSTGSPSQAINSLIKHKFAQSSDLFKKNLYSHYSCVNAIEFSNDGRWMVSGGDDKRVFLWNVEKALSGGKPTVMDAQHDSNIFCLEVGLENNRLFSGGNDEQIIVHDAYNGDALKVITLTDPIYCLSVDPSNDSLFAAACDDGRVYLFDLRESYNRDNLPAIIRKRSPFHSVRHNPMMPNFLVTSNVKHGVALWDVRHSRNYVIRYNGGLIPSLSAMSARFNTRGTQILAIRRRLSPVLYNIGSPYPIAEFEHPDYYNSCTMKTCCFAGPDDEYVLSGSDDFNLYVWKVPDEITRSDLPPQSYKWVDETHMTLSGHRSIINHVRYNYAMNLIASSGVEKMIKIWTPFDISRDFRMQACNEKAKPAKRKVFSHQEYVNLVLDNGLFSSNDSPDSTQEDPRMMAFFDTLVERDIFDDMSSSDEFESDESSSLDESSHNVYSDSPNDLPTDEFEEDPAYGGDSDTDSTTILDLQSLEYIEAFCQRVESSIKNSKKKAKLRKPTLSETKESSTCRRLRFDRSAHQSGQNDAEDEDDEAKARISRQIGEKKKEQVRKLAISAHRLVKNHLQNHRKSSPISSKTCVNNEHANLQLLKTKLENIVKELEYPAWRFKERGIPAIREGIRSYQDWLRFNISSQSNDSDDGSESDHFEAEFSLIDRLFRGPNSPPSITSISEIIDSRNSLISSQNEENNNNNNSSNSTNNVNEIGSSTIEITEDGSDEEDERNCSESSKKDVPTDKLLPTNLLSRFTIELYDTDSDPDSDNFDIRFFHHLDEMSNSDSKSCNKSRKQGDAQLRLSIDPEEGEEKKDDEKSKSNTLPNNRLNSSNNRPVKCATITSSSHLLPHRESSPNSFSNHVEPPSHHRSLIGNIGDNDSSGLASLNTSHSINISFKSAKHDSSQRNLRKRRSNDETQSMSDKMKRLQE